MGQLIINNYNRRPLLLNLNYQSYLMTLLASLPQIGYFWAVLAVISLRVQNLQTLNTLHTILIDFKCLLKANTKTLNVTKVIAY